MSFNPAMTAVADPATGFGSSSAVAPQRPRVLIAGAAEAVHRSPVMGLIASRPTFEICGTAEAGWEIGERVRELQPDVVVLDTSGLESNAAELVRQIRRAVATTEVVVVGATQPEELVFGLFEAGAKSFVLHEEASRYLPGAIEALAQHKPFLSPDIAETVLARALAQQPQLATAPTESRLTLREAQTLRLLAEGSSNKDVAAALGISVRTAETHRATLMRKLGLESIAAVVRYAVRNKIVEP